ncbi:MAG: YceI family protein [Candidatus Kapaibacterium sp.]
MRLPIITFLRVLLPPLAALLLCGFTDTDMRPMNVVYSIENGSSLSISGTSNVNTFSCLCAETFKRQVLEIRRDDSTRQIRFRNAVLKLPTESMDCNNSRMNSDLCDALKASRYPYIVVELQQIRLRPGATDAASNEWFDVVAMATLTITDVCKPIVMDVRGIRLSADRYRFVCSKNVRMTDFNVSPPTALFGLIKVNDDIRINLDITASVRDK